MWAAKILELSATQSICSRELPPTFGAIAPTGRSRSAKSARALTALNIVRGETLLIHSAIGRLARSGPAIDRAFDPVKYADDLLAMLLDLVGPEDTILVPAAPHMPGYELAVRGEIFDAKKTPAGTGLLPNLVMALPDSVRSLAPWQNIAAVGHHAATLVRNHLQSAPYAMGPGSPWHKLNEVGGKVALLGVDHDRSSTVHVLENTHPGEYPRPVFFDKPHIFRFLDENGSIGTVDAFLHAVRWQDEDIVRFCRYVGVQHGIYQGVPLGRTSLTVFSALDQYKAFLAEMQRGISMFDPAFWSRP
jgi:aminoglycoside N3'-acetyltransferase